MKKELLLTELKSLDISDDSLLFITINTGSIGYVNSNRSNTFDDILDLFTGLINPEKGGIIFASYTRGSFILKKCPNFNLKSKSYAGNFINHIIRTKQPYRSTHPFSSYIGFGERARRVIELHKSNSGPYSVFNSFVQENNSYYLMIGTWNDSRNAPPSLHHCQELLGLTRRFTFKYLEKIYHQDEKKIFYRTQSGGCSKGGQKLANELLENYIAKEFRLGDASSIIIDPIKSVDYTFDRLKANNSVYTCSDKYCLSCRGNYYTHPFSFIKIIFFKLSQRISKFISKA